MTELGLADEAARWARSYLPTALLCGAVAWFCYSSVFALFLILPLLVVLPWLIVNLVKAARHTSQRRARLVRAAMWVATFLSLVMWHVYEGHQRRVRADAFVRQLEIYRASHGQYPSTKDVALPKGDQLRFGVLYVFDAADPQQHEPFVARLSELDPFDKYVYRFQTHEWEFVAD